VLTENAAHELTYFVALEWEGADRQALAPLVDAALVWAYPNQMAELALPIVESLWADGLQGDIERALESAASAHNEVQRLLDDAKADLAAGPRRSRLARAVVEQGGHQLAGADMLPMHCLLCLEEGVAAASGGKRRGLALRVAQLARRVLEVPTEEIRAAVAASAVGGPEVTVALATDARRRLVRDWLAQLAELGKWSIPTVAEELEAALREPPAEPAVDPVWREAVAGLTDGFAAERN